MISMRDTVHSFTPFADKPVIGAQMVADFFGMKRPVSIFQLLSQARLLPHEVTFSQQVLTPAGTALGGSIDLTLRSDGTYTFAGHMHDSGFDPYSFRVRLVVRTPDGQAITLQHEGHTGGTTGSGSRDDTWSESNQSPHQTDVAAFIAGSWPNILSAKVDVSRSYEDTGVLGTIEDLVTDVVGFLIADVLAGPEIGVVLLLGAEIGRLTGASIVGPGGLVGVLVMAGTVMCFGPVMAIPAFVAGTVVGDLLIQHKKLSDAGIDPSIWDSVYEGTLPPADQIILINLSGASGRAFTAPNIDGTVLVNLGENYDDPKHDKRGKYPADYQLLIHELCHVWQIKNRSFLPGMLCEAVVDHVHAGDFGGKHVDIYTPPFGLEWDSYGIEQQATIVDVWFGGGMKPDDPSFNYIKNNIRMGTG